MSLRSDYGLDTDSDIPSDSQIRSVQRELDLKNDELDLEENSVAKFEVMPYFHVEKRFYIDKRGMITKIIYNREGFPIHSIEETTVDAPEECIEKAREIAGTYTPPKPIVVEWVPDDVCPMCLRSAEDCTCGYMKRRAEQSA